MYGTKSASSSLTVWSAAVVILAQLASLAGYTITEEDQAQIIALITTAASIIAGGLALYGRVRATKQIGDADA